MTKLKPYLKYLYLPGVFCFVAGAIAGLTAGSWSILELGLISLGSLIFIIWLGLLLWNSPGFLARRSTQAGTNALLTTVAIFVIVIGVNFLAFRYGGKIDLTENQLFTLSPQTETVIQQIREPVKIWVFDSQPAEGDKELLKNYQKMNNNLSFEFVNPDQQPSLVKEFKVKSQGDVFVEYQQKKQQVQTLISFNQRQPLSESQLTNAIEKIQRDRPINVYFLQGHGEHPLNSSKEGISEAVSSLENKGFTVNALNLGETPKIPENTNAIILAGPKRELLKSEVESLKTYSDRGGNLMVMVDAEAKPGLDPLLKPWGVSLDPRTVVDLSGAGELLGLGPATVIVTTYGQHPITQNFQNGLSLFPLSRAIATVKTPDVKAFTLLEASEKMVAKKELTEDLRIDEKQDLKGPFDLGVALERTVTVPPIAPSPTPSVSPSPNSSTSPSPIPSVSPSPNSVSSPIPTPQLSPSPNLSPESSPSPNLSPSPQLSPSLPISPSPNPSISPNKTSQQPSPQGKLVSYSLAQVPSASPSPAPSLSPASSPSPAPSISPSLAPSISPSPNPSPTPQGEKVTAKMVVIGNALFMTNQWFNEQLNGDVFLNSVQWLTTGEEKTLTIRPRSAKNRRITLNILQASVLVWSSLVIVPLLGIGGGIAVWWRRR